VSPSLLACESVFLLLTKDAGTRERAGVRRAAGLTAALLVDLVEAGRVTVFGGPAARIAVMDRSATGHGVLDAGLVELAARDGAPVTQVVKDRLLDPDAQIAAGLAVRGVVDIVPAGMHGLRPARYPMLDVPSRREPAARAAAALMSSSPIVHDEAVLAVLPAVRVECAALAHELPQLSRRELRARARARAWMRPGGLRAVPMLAATVAFVARARAADTVRISVDDAVVAGVRRRRPRGRQPARRDPAREGCAPDGG